MENLRKIIQGLAGLYIVRYGGIVGLRVLFLVTDLEIGGTPRVVRDLAIRLRDERIATTVASISPWGPVAGELRQANVRVVPLDATSSFQLPRVVRDVTRLSRSHDVVFSFLIHANTVAAIVSAFKPELRYFQSIQTTQPYPRWHWHLQGLIESRAEKIIVPSQSVKSFAGNWSHIAPDRVVVIPNAIDVAGYARLNTSPFTQPVVRVGFIGRLDPVKRVPELVSAMATVEGAELHIFGEGEDRARIESTIDGHHLRSRVILHGRIGSAHPALKQIDALVLPSVAEGFGLVLIEAMAAGVPVIATDVAGIRDIVSHERTGLLVRGESSAALPQLLAQAIERLRADAAFRGRLIANAQDEVMRRYTWPSILAQYQRLLLD